MDRNKYNLSRFSLKTFLQTVAGKLFQIYTSKKISERFIQIETFPFLKKISITFLMEESFIFFMQCFKVPIIVYEAYTVNCPCL